MKSHPLRHVACIMDGNRRWAARGAVSEVVHRQKAIDAILSSFDACLQRGISYLSLYAFSLENYRQRPAVVTTSLCEAVAHFCGQYADECLRKGIRVSFIGARHLYPSFTRAAIEALEHKTREARTLTVQILFFYGGQQEIVDAVVQCVREGIAGRLQPEALTTYTFSQYLSTAAVPAPDLIIRTGGRARLSNFLLYQAAYSECMFLSQLWPDITKEVLLECFTAYDAATRNFGA